MRKINRSGIEFMAISAGELKRVIFDALKVIKVYDKQLIEYERIADPTEKENFVKTSNDIVNAFAVEFIEKGIPNNPLIKLLFGISVRLIHILETLLKVSDEIEIPMITDDGYIFSNPLHFALVGIQHDPRNGIFIIPRL